MVEKICIGNIGKPLLVESFDNGADNLAATTVIKLMGLLVMTPGLQGTVAIFLCSLTRLCSIMAVSSGLCSLNWENCVISPVATCLVVALGHLLVWLVFKIAF